MTCPSRQRFQVSRLLSYYTTIEPSIFPCESRHTGPAPGEGMQRLDE